MLMYSWTQEQLPCGFKEASYEDLVTVLHPVELVFMDSSQHSGSFLC